MIYFSVDPGASGGLAFLHEGMYSVANMPDTITDLRYLLDGMRDKDELYGIMENVGGFFSGGQKMRCKCGAEINAAPRSGPAMAKFSGHCGELRGLLVGMKIRFEKVAPGVWMKGFAGTLPKEKTKRKNQIKALAQQLHPDIKITLKTADAMGILEWYLDKHGLRQKGAAALF